MTISKELLDELLKGCERPEAKAPMAVPVGDGYIEIELAGGHRMRISDPYDPEALARLIRGLSV